MRTRIVLAIILLAVGLCLVPALGYGEVEQWRWETNISLMEAGLIEARVDYIMLNPDGFLDVRFYYDYDGTFGKKTWFPEGVDTEGRIVAVIHDTRGVFSYGARVSTREWELELWKAYAHIDHLVTDMDTDVVALFSNEKGDLLGYFYQGEYHLRGE